MFSIKVVSKGPFEEKQLHMLYTRVIFLARYFVSSSAESYVTSVKFRLSEKQTKFEKNLPRGFDKSADLLSKWQKMRKVFANYVCFSESPNFNSYVTYITP